MIVFTFSENHDVPDFARDIVSGYRWILEINSDVGLSVGLYHQYQDAIDDVWRRGGRYYDISVTRFWGWGRRHSFYDGPHDSLSLGCLHISWSGKWCDRCYEGR